MRKDRNDRQMMLSPDRWPMWPTLPLIDRKNRRLAVLVAVPGHDEKAGTVMFVAGNMMDLPADTPPTPVDVDVLLADGWVVD